MEKNTSDALERIETYFREFCEGVENCLKAEFFDRGDLLDAYSRLARLRDRFSAEAEKGNLDPAALRALAKVFENDVFIRGMMNLRQVAEHVTKKGSVLEIWTTSNAPVSLDSQSSAASVFSSLGVTLTDVTGSPFRLEHPKMLREAEKRITNAMGRTGWGETS